MILFVLLAAASFDLAPSRVTAEQVKNCRVDETIPLGTGTAEKRTCGPSLDAQTALKKCKEAARHNALPVDVTEETCPAEYAKGHFLFRGETRELVIARRKDGHAVTCPWPVYSAGRSSIAPSMLASIARCSTTITAPLYSMASVGIGNSLPETGTRRSLRRTVEEPGSRGLAPSERFAV